MTGLFTWTAINIIRLAVAIDVVAPAAKPDIKLALIANVKVLDEAGINNPKRIKAFLAQMSHESMGFKRLVEMRSDLSAESKYGHKSRVGKVLGNTKPGDGAFYKGRGIIQLTGRDNYERYGEMVGLDLIKNPILAADIDNAILIAATYWDSKGLNQLADEGKFQEITRRINGGYNGHEDRVRRLKLLDGVKI